MNIGQISMMSQYRNNSVNNNKKSESRSYSSAKTNSVDTAAEKQPTCNPISFARRVVLCIMDGWGLGKKDSKTDATVLANPENVNRLMKEGSYTTIYADGEHVGLPEGQMGNSEVGHLNIGAGRIVYQDLSKINRSIADGSFFENKQFLDAIEHAKKNKSALHLYGLVSDGGVHSSLDHLKALIKLSADQGLKDVYVHAFLDGRDTPPQSACKYLEDVEKTLKENNLPPIATVIGRYYIMDRDNRWERVEKGYDALTLGEGYKASSAVEAVKQSYERGDNDEFVMPTVIGDEKSRIKDNDAVIFFNYRPDRAREISKAINFKDFDGSDPKLGFDRKKVLNNIHYVTMTDYDKSFDFPVAFKKEKMINKLGDVLEKFGIKQFRTAETEKYAHVTFFANGGEEAPQPHEERVLVPSPKVATYDMQPEMSANEVCDNVVNAIKNPDYGFIMVNFANPDMVGHTGNLDAAVKACKTVDNCVGRIAKECDDNDVTLIVTADHGNAEVMVNPETGKPHTAHTTNKVPFIIYDKNKKYNLRSDGALCNIAATVLQLIGIKKPDEMADSMIK